MRMVGGVLTDDTRLNFFEVARAAFFSRGNRYKVALAELVY